MKSLSLIQRITLKHILILTYIGIDMMNMNTYDEYEYTCYRLFTYTR